MLCIPQNVVYHTEMTCIFILGHMGIYVVKITRITSVLSEIWHLDIMYRCITQWRFCPFSRQLSVKTVSNPFYNSFHLIIHHQNVYLTIWDCSDSLFLILHSRAMLNGVIYITKFEMVYKWRAEIRKDGTSSDLHHLYAIQLLQLSNSLCQSSSNQLWMLMG